VSRKEVVAAEFQATDCWQEVKEGQAIPGELHVRSNLSTGKTEAKVMAAEETPSCMTLCQLPD